MSELRATIQLSRGEFALDVELACPPGITCVMGPSGSGKSTILAVLAGLALPDRGKVTLGDQVWLDRARGIAVPVHERRLAYVFQGLALFPHMSGLHNVTYGMQHVPRADRPAKAQALLDRLGVGHLARRRPRTFSGGEAQRVALARAIARAPHVVLLDEPFSALDRELRAQLTSLVRELVAELGVPLVHVTHSVAEARLLADQVVRVERGQIVARGTVSEVLANLTTLEE
ncbi:MAG: ATP-binding cassette domain-containing protein [Deltaproteobacteria bacterium]|nr:ATP-binding cassette domain-containing protein [Deltaproteobacteria bacterium]MDQ3296470.1 ATP-binding cassette domain-containing protein [Myxococcota bacterium]